MHQRAGIRLIVISAAVVVLTIGLSLLRDRILPSPGAKPEPPQELVLRNGMTLEEFGKANGLDRPVLRAVFALKDASQLKKPLSDYNMSSEDLSQRVHRAIALRNENASKDWGKILLKFALWVVFLAFVFVLVRRGLVRSRLRVVLYSVAVLTFGVVLGSDPSPMGTVKDAVALYGAVGAIFRPRMIAMAAFLVMALLANKFICAWGCQLGALQDLLLRIRSDVVGIRVSWKPPFAVTNTVRVSFFAVMVVFAFLFAFDIVEPIDPFKVYKPTALTIAGAGFLVSILAASLFMYRPWCHLFCPFGLLGWLIEKISVFKVTVDYDTCIACGACEKACPSTVMGAILKRDRAIPDCFACATCIESCPVGAVQLRAGRRSLPRPGKFERRAGRRKVTGGPDGGTNGGSNAVSGRRS